MPSTSRGVISARHAFIFGWIGLPVAATLAPSRAPLGGTYAAPEASASAKPKVAASASPRESSSDEDAGTPESKPKATASAVASASASSTPPSESPGTLHYDPLKAGERVHADVEVGMNATMEGVPQDFGGGAMQINVKSKIDVKVVKASAQELEQLEITLTPLSMHTEFGGQSSDSPQEPARVYDVTVTGSSPSIQARSGKTETEARRELLWFVAPLLEFQRRWAASPTLSPGAGYHSSIPLNAASFMTDPSDTFKIGPLAVSDGGSRTHDRTPFDLALPLEMSGNFGKMSIELIGKAELNPRARPISLELSGPSTGSVGPNTSVTLKGDAKISMKFNYD